MTSLACWTLSSAPDSSKIIAAGLNWLCEDWPRDSSLWQRLLRKFSAQRDIFPINDSYRGWGWTPHTSSWVEPSSFALLALEQAPEDLVPSAAARRRELAESMLRDRMCPDGGWNCGNPRVLWRLRRTARRPHSLGPAGIACPRNDAENCHQHGLASSERSQDPEPCLPGSHKDLFRFYGRPWPRASRS